MKYRKKRVNAHGLHSPFVFEFYNEIIKKRKLGSNVKVESLRSTLVKDHTKIEVVDLGAGSRKGLSNIRTISAIAKNAAITRKQGELFGRIISHYELSSILELGTSLGLASAYMGMASNNVEVDTIEGCKNIAENALEHFRTLGLENVKLEIGEFSQILAKDQFKDKVYDFIYLDGNHQLEPTLSYFEFAMNHTHDDSFIVLDDIHWSEEMEKAWAEIKASTNLNVTMDLFGCGIVCKRPGQRKEHFVLKF